MTAVTVPGAVPRSLIGKVAAVIGRTPKARRRAALIAAAAREHVITLTALGCADAAAFSHSAFAGLLTACACLLVLDFKIQN